MPCSFNARMSFFNSSSGADLGIDLVVVDDVVAVHPGARFQERRRINVADAEPREIRHEASGVGELKPLCNCRR